MSPHTCPPCLASVQGLAPRPPAGGLPHQRTKTPAAHAPRNDKSKSTTHVAHAPRNNPSNLLQPKAETTRPTRSMTMTAPEPRPKSALSRSFVPLALITVGVVFLLGNLIPGPGRGGLILLGLGIAFAIGRVT